MSVEIHPSSLVEEGVEIGDGTRVDAFSIIRRNVKLGRNNVIGPHVVIEGHTVIGDENRIFQFASVGAIPQDLKYRGEASVLEIGSRNIIRECVTLQPGTEGGGMVTRIGDQNLFMANSHVGHDSRVGNFNVFANSVSIAGHVVVGNRVILGGLSGVHQFVRIGDLALLSAGSMAAKDVPPFCIVHGDRAGLVGINKIGLQRAGFSAGDIARVRRLYRELFLSHGIFKARAEAVRNEAMDFEGGKILFEFVTSSQRGICSLRSDTED